MQNVSNAAAVNLRTASALNRSNTNPFDQELDRVGVIADVFPNQKKVVPIRREFQLRNNIDTLYFHARVDYEDLSHYKYSYRATYWIFANVDSVRGNVTYTSYRSGYQWSQFEKLGKK